MSSVTKELLEGLGSWPKEDQDELAEYAREIKAHRTGIYVMTDEERAAVQIGMRQAERGEFVSEKDMDVFWKKVGVK